MTHVYSRMTAPILVVVLIGLGFGVLQSTPASAKGNGVSAVAVAAACNRTAGCSYAGTPGGHMTGCSPHACFDCNKGKCHPFVQKGPTGTTGPGAGHSAGTTTTAASGGTSRHPITNIHQPVVLERSASSHSSGSRH